MAKDVEESIAHSRSPMSTHRRDAAETARQSDDRLRHRSPRPLVFFEDRVIAAPRDDVGEHPSKMKRVLNSRVHPLSPCGAVHVGRVAGQKDATEAVVHGQSMIDAHARAPHDLMYERR